MDKETDKHAASSHNSPGGMFLLCISLSHPQVSTQHLFITPHVQRERDKVIGVGVHICIYMFVDKKNLNCTSAIDSLFQTFTVGLLVEFID